MLLGLLVIAHLWAHARAAEEEPFGPAGSVVIEHGHDHDHHVDHAHGGTFLLPAAKSAFLKAMPLRAPLPPAESPPATEPHMKPPEHIPKCGHRERAVRNHTLEVYRP
ncbi:hypothetical protein [Nonomuraea turcica]|uniref:hypothetical protein n=1 Tax=Nonomuraea sp. G32 TaxID=3067274 RepID=UPI00273B6301|nr:hypothetical protein [Nonomuraea sp. G32]MDP4505456.1 hypothetical protein [Nonomuraea sp. G32]